VACAEFELLGISLTDIMINFLFWNINRKPLKETIARIVSHYSIDVLILAECEISTEDMLHTLNKMSVEFNYSPGNCEKIKIYLRFSDDFFQPQTETSRLTIRRLTLPGLTEILVAATHFPSKYNWSDESQKFEAIELASIIRDTEVLVGHSRTVLVGDLNMNPFESGLVSANGLHGVMTREIALRRHRTVQDKRYPFFYNPMWGYFGDRTDDPAGTYHYPQSAHVSYFWNIFDQVLIRPDLLSAFKNDDLIILRSDGEKLLVTSNGFPDHENASDHLPILFRLSL
jgi:hypothetical protein